MYSLILSQTQEMHKIINKMYLQPLNMFRQINCYPQGVFIKELQLLIATKYTIVRFTVQVFAQLTILKYRDAWNYKIKS
jgi:low affinity Fe/Cu permease